MSLRRVGVLFGKEFIHGPKNYMFILSLVAPLLLSLLLSLVFGTYFGGKSRLGLVDQGGSQLRGLVQKNEAVSVRIYGSLQELRDASARGSVDVGLMLPPQFDQHIRSNDQTKMTVYVWGESRLRDRLVVASAITHAVHQIAGHELPVEIVQDVLGGETSIPWEKRLLPMIVLMPLVFAGSLVPATSLVTEKTKHTLTALAASPATLGEVYMAKGLIGVLLSLVTSIMVLSLNRAFIGESALLLGVLLMGSVFGASIGVLLGAAIKDINTLFAVIKGMGLLLYAPALIRMFPQVPQWIARLFPTYYVIQPVLEISQNNAGWSEIAPEMGVLVGLIAVSLLAAARMATRGGEA